LIKKQRKNLVVHYSDINIYQKSFSNVLFRESKKRLRESYGKMISTSRYSSNKSDLVPYFYSSGHTIQFMWFQGHTNCGQILLYWYTLSDTLKIFVFSAFSHWEKTLLSAQCPSVRPSVSYLLLQFKLFRCGFLLKMCVLGQRPERQEILFLFSNTFWSLCFRGLSGEGGKRGDFFKNTNLIYEKIRSSFTWISWKSFRVSYFCISFFVL